MEVVALPLDVGDDAGEGVTGLVPFAVGEAVFFCVDFSEGKLMIAVGKKRKRLTCACVGVV